MPKPRVAIATCAKFPSLFAEEAKLPALLAAHGVDAEPRVWNDASVRWSAYDLVLVRATWDYVQHVAAFRAWLDALDAAGVRAANPTRLVRWNLDKRYLRELASRGASVLPTEVVEPGTRADLAAIVRARGWDEVVLKPAISANAFRTVRFSARDAGAHQAELDAIVAGSAALVQPFAPEIATEGEWSLFFFDGAFSHAVLKVPARGDFRVQGEFGGVDRALEPDARLLREAAAVVAAFPEPPRYVRVDGVRLGGTFHLMEAEAIEPYLYTADRPEALERYAACVAAWARG